jgi:hypothetical protein
LSTSDVKLVEIGADDPLHRVERAAAAEHRETREQALLIGSEEVVAPFDGRAQGALALGQVSRPASQEWQPPIESREICAADNVFTRAAASSNASGRSSRRRQISATAASARKLGFTARSRDERRDALVGYERKHRVLLLTGDVERLPAGDEEVKVRQELDDLAALLARGPDATGGIDPEKA